MATLGDEHKDEMTDAATRTLDHKLVVVVVIIILIVVVVVVVVIIVVVVVVVVVVVQHHDIPPFLSPFSSSLAIR